MRGRTLRTPADRRLLWSAAVVVGVPVLVGVAFSLPNALLAWTLIAVPVGLCMCAGYMSRSIMTVFAPLVWLPLAAGSDLVTDPVSGEYEIGLIWAAPVLAIPSMVAVGAGFWLARRHAPLRATEQ